MSDIVTNKRLSIPSQGNIEYHPGFVPTEAVEELNSAFSNANQAVLFTGEYQTIEDPTPLHAADPISSEQGLAIHALAKIVVPEVDTEWDEYGVAVRRMGNPGLSSLAIHKDGARDIRVLVEGHQSRWHFGDSSYKERYPEGLELSAGDVVVLNNMCPRSEQLAHGVAIGNVIPIRLSYLFYFHS